MVFNIQQVQQLELLTGYLNYLSKVEQINFLQYEKQKCTGPYRDDLEGQQKLCQQFLGEL